MKRFFCRPGVLSAFLFLVVMPQAVFSQTGEKGASGDGKISQRLSWGPTNAWFYEVEIEQDAGGGFWKPELKKRTNDTWVEVSLAPGMYRFRVHGYTVNETIGASSDWATLRIYLAKEPQVERFYPPSYHYDANEKEFRLTLYGQNLVESAGVMLVRHGRENALPILPQSIEYGIDESQIVMVFSTEKLIPGSWDITVTNPGGLSQTTEGFKVDFTRPRDITVSAGFAPVIPLFGDFFTEGFYESAFYPLGLYLRSSFVPVKMKAGFIGAEMTLSYTGLKTSVNDYTLEGRLVTANLDAVYQLWFNNWTMAFDFRLGPGITILDGINFRYTGAADQGRSGTYIININAGAGFRWLVWQNLFVEAGIDYIQGFSAKDSPPAYLRAGVGAGWRF